MLLYSFSSSSQPDQSRGLVPRHNMRTISGISTSSHLLFFFIEWGVVLHEHLVGKEELGLWFTWLGIPNDVPNMINWPALL